MDLIGGVLNLVPNMLNAVTSGESAKFNQQSSIQNFDYQRRLQQKIFEREDSSVQRRVTDLEKAGLSKVLAAGAGASAGQAIQTQAPQMQAPTADFSSTISGILGGAEYDNKKATKKLIDEQAKTEVAKQRNLNAQSGLAGTTSEKTRLETLIKNDDWLRTQDFGTSSNPSPIAKVIQDLIGVEAYNKLKARKNQLSTGGGGEFSGKGGATGGW